MSKVKYLGLLTYAANNFALPDGRVTRDSEGVKFRANMKARKDKVKVVKCRRVRPDKPCVGNWQILYSAKPKGHTAAEGACKRKGTHATAFVQKQEAAFQEWWREARAASLQPRSETVPTAQDRMSGLRRRVAARIAASQA